MKIIHTADLHLDSALSTHLTGDKKRIRKSELLQSFMRLIEYANKNEVTAILIAGDFFDVQKLTLKTKTYIFELIEKNSQIKFFYLCGNHDENVIAKADAIVPENLIMFNDKVTTYNLGEGVTISGLELNYANYQSFYKTINLKPDQVNIFMLHGQLDASSNNYEKIDLKQLQNKNINYLALGHYHTFQTGKLDNYSAFAYSGCLEGRGFDETETKGFVLIDVKSGRLSFSFVPFSLRMLHIVNVNITDIETLVEQEKAISNAVKGISENDLLRIVLTGTAKLNQRIDVTHLLSVFDKRFFYVEIVKQTRLKITPQEYVNDISLKGVFVKEVMNSNLPEGLKEQVLYAGIGALLGQEVK